MAPCLEDCPNELVALIVDLLPLHDICSLRHTSRTLAVKAAQDKFKSFFHHKRVFLTRDSLERFSHATKPGLLGCLLRTLTVTGVAINTLDLARTVRAPNVTAQARDDAQRHLDILLQRRAVNEEFRKSGMDVTMLSETFSSLAASGISLEELSVRIAVYRTDSEQVLEPHEGGNWRLIWYCASRTYRITMQAMTASQISIKTLDVYTKDDCCSIACNELSDAGGNAELDCYPSMKSFAMSFSERYLRETEQDIGITDECIEYDYQTPKTKRDLSTIQVEADDESNFAGLADQLRKFPRLVTLDLHLYRLNFIPGVHRHSAKFLERILEVAPLPHLQHLTLRGLVARERDLLRLVEITPLRSLSLESIHIAEGSFQAVFDICTSASSNIERLYFDDLFESGHIQFDGPGIFKYPVPNRPLKRDPHRSHNLDRSGMEVKQAISYTVPRGRTKASARLYAWHNKRRRLYGK